MPGGYAGAPSSFAAIDASLAGDTTVVAAVAGRRIRVVKYSFLCAAAVTVRWKSGAGTNLSGLMAFAANGGISEPYCPVGILQTALGEALVINLSGAVGVGGLMTYEVVV